MVLAFAFFALLVVENVLLVVLWSYENKKPVGFELSSNMHLTTTFILSYLYQLCITYLSDISFSLFIPITFQTVNTYASIQH